MAIYFPQFLSSKAIIQDGYRSTRRFQTDFNRMDAGPIHSFANFGASLTNFPTEALSGHEWTVNITDTELATLLAFYQARDGQLEEFIFLDPAGNMASSSEDFSTGWSIFNLTLGAAVTDPFGGTRATSITGTAADSFLHTLVIPDGDADGLIFTVSVWARATGASQQLKIGFIDGPGVDDTIWDLPQNQWIRITHTHTLTSALTAFLLIGGNATWGSSEVIQLFGAQCVPMLGPGDYVQSPAFFGRRDKCRFDMPSISWRKDGPNNNAVSIKIKEIF